MLFVEYIMTSLVARIVLIVTTIAIFQHILSPTRPHKLLPIVPANLNQSGSYTTMFAWLE